MHESGILCRCQPAQPLQYCCFGKEAFKFVDFWHKRAEDLADPAAQPHRLQ